MAALTKDLGIAMTPPPARARSQRRSVPVWRWVILLVAAVYFLLPLYAAIRFAGLHAFGSVVTQAGFGSALWLSVKLAVVTWLITMLLMIPTTVYVHLRMPKLRRLLETITILPIVIPPVVLIIGVLQVMPLALRSSVWLLAIEYVVLAMPFAYRALDAGLRSIDVKTLTEASGSLGAGIFTTMWRVLLPNLRTALLSSTILIVALVLGEFTMASLDLQTTFPVWIVLFDQENAQISVAASIFALS
jgi:putative spermidine/putrescine transport system permease protein